MEACQVLQDVSSSRFQNAQNAQRQGPRPLTFCEGELCFEAPESACFLVTSKGLSQFSKFCCTEGPVKMLHVSDGCRSKLPDA